MLHWCKWIKRGILGRLWWYDGFPLNNIPEQDGNDDKQSAYHDINSTSTYVCEALALLNNPLYSEYLNDISIPFYMYNHK